MYHVYGPLPQIFHHIKGASQLQVPPQLRPFTVSFLCEEEPPPPRSTPWEHTGHKAAISWLPNWCGVPIQNAHIPPLAITARYQCYTLVR